MVSPKTQFTDWDTTASNNTDINGVGIQGTNQVSNFDDALRTVMAQLASGVDPKMVFTSRTSAYTPLKADNNKFDRYTAAVTVPLTAAATLTANWHYTFWADGADIVIDPNGAETINGNATLTIRNGQSALVWCTGTAFIARVFDGSQTGLQNQGYLNGLTLSNNAGDATNDIDIAAGSAAADTAPFFVMNNAATITKRLDAAWAVGSGNGGLDTGAIADTTYHVFLIQRSDTGVVDALFSTSASAPTMPANYDRKRRIGSIVRRIGSIKSFVQTGDMFQWVFPGDDINASNPGTSAVTATVTVPTGLIVEVFGNINLSTNVASADQIAYVSDLRSNNGPPDATQYFTTIHRSAGVIVRSSGFWRVACNTSGQIRYRVSASDANTVVRINTIGYIDYRGRL